MRNDGRDVDLYYLFSKKTWWTFIRRWEKFRGARLDGPIDRSKRRYIRLIISLLLSLKKIISNAYFSNKIIRLYLFKFILEEIDRNRNIRFTFYRIENRSKRI